MGDHQLGSKGNQPLFHTKSHRLPLPDSHQGHGRPSQTRHHRQRRRRTTTPTGLPTVSGIPRVGEDLTAHTDGIDDDDGLNAPNFTYQWVRVDGNSETNIASATDASYILAPEDGGKRIKVKVTFTDDLSNTEGPIASAPTGIVNTPATGEVAITGTPRVGKTLTADTSGIIDPDGKPESTFTYQWSPTNGVPIAGATRSTYTLTDADGDGWS